MKLKRIFLTMALAVSTNAVQAVPYYETAGIIDGSLQGGSTSFVRWLAPNTAKYKVHVQVQMNSMATNALYRIYPKGNAVTNTACSSTDAAYPCFEVAVNQALNKGKWVQLMLNNATSTQWTFTKNVGFISLNAGNSATTETLGASTVRFERLFPATGYSKISNSGVLLPDGGVLGTAASDWGCTRDNETGLIWEVKTDDGGLRDKDNTYSWYDPNPLTNGNDIGTANGGTCTANIPCDTDAYVLAINARKLCGHNDWRLPNESELLSILYRAQIPTINLIYFPNTLAKNTWTTSFYTYSFSSTTYPISVDFNAGNSNHSSRSNNYAVRLVRNGQ